MYKTSGKTDNYTALDFFLPKLISLPAFLVSSTQIIQLGRQPCGKCWPHKSENRGESSLRNYHNMPSVQHIYASQMQQRPYSSTW